MAITRAAFIVQFPEFTRTNAEAAGQALIDAMLVAATLEVDPELWGALTTQGIMYLAAHKLAVSPWGNATQLTKGDGTSTYETHYKALRRSVAGGGLLL